jgi:hypothetical protein
MCFKYRMENHNLDIRMYSFKELLELFDLDYNITMEDLKMAKKKLVRIHPDKSKLPNEYFMFYKEAFDTILHFCKDQTKQNVNVGIEKREYVPKNDLNEEHKKRISKEITSMSSVDFNSKFNKLFDDNMVTKKDYSKYEFFKNDESQIQVDETVNQGNMGQVFENIKNQQQDLVKYRGVQEMQSRGGNNLYDEDNDEYACSDPFSKLKFDDLRKVHKDETIFSVKEADIHNRHIHSSVESLRQERGVGYTPMEKTNAEKLLQNQQSIHKGKILEKQHTSNIQNISYQEKNKTILSQFLKLTN